MNLLCKRIRKKLRIKSKKSIKSSVIRSIWKDYVDCIVNDLIKYGKIDIDKYTSLEIVGKRKLKVIRLKKGGIASTSTANKLRPGIIYKIVLKERGHDNLIFIANSKIRKKISEALLNTSNYYRIAS